MSQQNRIAPEMEDFGTEPIATAEVPPQPRRPRKVRVQPDAEGPQRPKQRPKAKEKPKPRSFNPVAFFGDQRWRWGLGVVLVLLAVVSVCCCISFMASNSADQSVTLGRSAQEIVAAGDTLQNAGNAIGAKLAHLLLVDTLGVGSLVVAVYLFLLGLACVGMTKISFWSLSFRTLFTAVALSVIVGLISYNQPLTFPPGGFHGQYINRLLMDYSGALGAFGVAVALAALLVVVYIHPIKAIAAALRRIMPKRSVVEDLAPEESPEETEQPLAVLDGEVTEPQPTGEEPSDEGPEARNAADTTLADLDMLGSDEGFDIDDTPNDIAAGPVPASEETPAEVAELPSAEVPEVADAAEVTVVKPETAPGEPEMIIKVPSENTTSQVGEAQPIRHGDHIGLDSTYDPRAAHSNYCFPPTDLLMERDAGVEINEEEQAANKQMIVKAFRSFGIEIVRIEATIGPTVTLYEIVPSEGTRISKIKSLEDDIAMTISATGIRIIAPIPGRGTIGIEVPNRKRQIVSMRKVLESATFRKCCKKMHLPVALGATISNDIYVQDLTKMPHLLVAGATGQGKSVGLNCLITSLLYSKHPDELKFVLVDPKAVEFTLYNKIVPHFMAKLPEEEQAIITDPQKTLATLNSLCVEMDRRYELLSSALVRDVESYNQKFTSRHLNPDEGHRYLPYLVVIVDEFADLISTAGKEIFLPIARIAQKGRASGIHMVIATQRPSTDVITGMIKANFPARIAFRVLSSIDSKTILDRPGAHRLTGMGDMLTFINGGTERVQCALVDTEECEEICSHIAAQPGVYLTYELPEVPTEEGTSTERASVNVNNEEFRQCALYTSLQTAASITILQRKFGIGFNKAGRYMDQMEALGIVGPANGSKPRQVLMTPESVQMLFDTASAN